MSIRNWGFQTTFQKSKKKKKYRTKKGQPQYFVGIKKLVQNLLHNIFLLYNLKIKRTGLPHLLLPIVYACDQKYFHSS